MKTQERRREETVGPWKAREEISGSGGRGLLLRTEHDCWIGWGRGLGTGSREMGEAREVMIQAASAQTTAVEGTPEAEGGFRALCAQAGGSSCVKTVYR